MNKEMDSKVHRRLLDDLNLLKTGIQIIQVITVLILIFLLLITLILLKQQS